MRTGRPRIYEGKEYTYIAKRKRKDGNFDVIEVTSKYDPKTKNNRPCRTRKLGVVLAGYKDLQKEMIRVGTPEAAAYTAKARMRRWPNKQPKEIPSAVSSGTALVEEKRQEGKIVFPLRIVVMVMLLAAMAGITSAYKVAEFWKTFRKVLEILFPDFPKEDISHDTVRRVTQILGRADNEKFILALTEPLIRTSARRHIAIDGQAVRAATIDDKVPYIFNVYDVTNGLTLSQKLIGPKKNEISEALSLIQTLDLRGCILTADAMNAQKKFVSELITKKKCDYCLSLRENQKRLYKNVQMLFELEPSERQRRGHPDLQEWHSEKQQKVDKGHGRLEERSVWVLPARLVDENLLKDWCGLADGIIVKAVTEQTCLKTGKTTGEVRYFVSSLRADSPATLAEVAEIIRGHWGIESKLHWVLDATFLQDRTQCTNADFLVGRTLILKVANNWLTAFQAAESEDPEKRSSKERWKVRCLDLRTTWDRICTLFNCN